MSKSYTLMELEAIKKLCKCVNSVASLPTDLIADTNVATNTTYSSYRINAEIIALENDIQRYVDTALAGLSRLTKEVIDDKTLVVKENVLYLYKDPSDINNDYMQMLLINGTVVELGSTTCDFSSVYSKDEIDDKFALKIDLDVLTTSFNNLVTSVDKKIDKDKITTVLDDTVTDEDIPSAKAVNIRIEERIDDKIDEKLANFTGGGGGSATLTEDITTNIEVGGVKSGTLLGTGLTFNEYVRMVHVTYLAPGVTLSITPSTTLYKVGSTVTGLVAKVTVTKKSEDITKIEFLVNDVVKETITTDVANGGTFSYTVDDFTTDTTIKAIVYDASSNVPKTSTVKFVNPYYCGTTDDVPTADTVVTLTELVETKGSKTRTVTCSNKHVVIAYPASYGKLTSILDGNGFENLTDYTNIQETINGVSYEIYYTTGKKTLTNFKYTYK